MPESQGEVGLGAARYLVGGGVSVEKERERKTQTWRKVWLSLVSVQSLDQPAEILFQSNCKRPLWAALPWAGTSTLWCCPSSISSANHSITHLHRCLEGWFWRGWYGICRTCIFLSLGSCQEVPVDLQWRWPCSAPIHWYCAPSRRCREVSSGIWSQRPQSFFQSASRVNVFFVSRTLKVPKMPVC